MSSMENIAEGLLLSDSARQKFSAAVDKQNLIAQTAIQSLDCLNDQIVQFIFTPVNNSRLEHETDLGSKAHETLQSSVVLIRRLLLDAQAKFRKMVDDNKQIAAKIDGSINAANQEVSALRAELEATNKRLSQLSASDVVKIENGVHLEQTDAHYTSRQRADEENELKQLKDENQRLESNVRTLTREISELRKLKVVNSDQLSYGELKLDLIQTKQDLNRAKEALAALKADRKRLKGEKLQLLNQMKQLYLTLEEKESELRDFMRNYEQRMRESDESIKQLVAEKDQCDREKWEIIQKARHAAEQAVFLQTQSESREEHIQKLETELIELQDQVASSKIYNLDLPSTPKSLDSHTPSEELQTFDTSPPSATDSSKEECFHVPSSTPNIKSRYNTSNSFSPLNQFNDNNDMTEGNKTGDSQDTSTENRKKKRINLSSSISRAFSRGRSRHSLTVLAKENDELPANTRITLLNAENYQEKLKIVDQLKSCHMSMWKANQVLAWLEVVLNMPMYGNKCATNIKSGKVLLGMSDSDLASALDIKHPLHKKKLRLAIEEQRTLTDGTLLKCSSLDHGWVVKWLHDIGLPQYSVIFDRNLVDGRMLNNMTRKDLEKHLDVHRKFHQTSILHAVQLLRKLGFDKEVLVQRKTACEKDFTDPLVWTNQQVIKWVQSIDLEEFADNLKESGVHGALIVLEPTFTADTLASCLNIPPSKLYIRRHLQTELESLVRPAREDIILKRSANENSRNDSQSKMRLNLRGSLGRAFGKKVKEEMQNSKQYELDIESPKQKRTSAPVIIDMEDIHEHITELDRAMEQNTYDNSHAL